MGKFKLIRDPYLNLNGTCCALAANVDHVLATIVNNDALAHLYSIASRSDCTITDRLLQCTWLANRIFSLNPQLLKLLTISYNALDRANTSSNSLIIAKRSAASLTLVSEITG